MDEEFLSADARPQWRLFLRALADEVDSLAGPNERDDMLRGMGRRISRMAPIPHVEHLDALEIEMNGQLSDLGWGRVALRLDEQDRALVIQHAGLPKIGSLGSPPGTWLTAMLEGLYEGWLGQQPGSQATLIARRVANSMDPHITLRYARA